ncbi:MAG TPA: TetR/AcrR family transcriptional regulator [Actinospica sp.]|jgi:AcrR family transcriptional regulator|nr:TetR/AcrR family transcriptional regulator [Actinospica sp.]
MGPEITERPGALGRRAQGKLLARRRLLDSAVDLFVEKGYDSTKIDDIAQRAGLARATFFKHFQHKQDLLEEWSAWHRDRVERALDAEDAARAAHDTHANRLRSYVNTLAGICVAERSILVPVLTPWFRLSHPPARDDCTLAARFADVFEAGMKAGEFTTEVSAAEAGRILSDLYLAALRRWCGESDRPDEAFADDLAAALTVVLRGVGAAGRSDH